MFTSKKILINGIVQGVGFRPYIYTVAKKNNLKGNVFNNNNGVIIEIEGEDNDIKKFMSEIMENPPPIALIEQMEIEDTENNEFTTFDIVQSRGNLQKTSTFISPDIAVCKDCLDELYDPSNRRFGYPFINCTNCGPRFTITENVPYDRPFTTMSKFHMCIECHAEYTNPEDRRYHAQPIACPRCGPKLILKSKDGTRIKSKNIIEEIKNLLLIGEIVAIKGLGGYHLACDATSNEAVAKLRKRKFRIEKPFAVMIPSTNWLDKLCEYNEFELELLNSVQRPIVLLKKNKHTPLSEYVSPGNKYVGIILPYSPLHHILMTQIDRPLVMTSGNISNEPIVYKDNDALSRLRLIADYYLSNDREIFIRCDDSVSAFIGGNKTILRRSRGFVPYPYKMPFKSKTEILAIGGQLKNTFCFLKNQHAYLSQHIGDIENYSTYKSFTDGIEHFKKIFSLDPKIIACDKHPDYLSTKYAVQSEGINKISVQHHHAHIASCMIDNNLEEKIIGIAFDGTGFGDDKNIWGGEFLVADLSSYERVAHLDYVKIPGGAKAIEEPWRMAYSFLKKTINSNLENLGIAFIDKIHKYNHREIANIDRMIDKNINIQLTSSAGRLFDAVSCLLNYKKTISYEAQAAIELQTLADESEEGTYSFGIDMTKNPWVVILDDTIMDIISDLQRNVNRSRIAGKFHNTCAKIICNTCEFLRNNYSLSKIVLSGGTFQNALLTKKVIKILAHKNFDVFNHKNIPPNDGGLCIGQAAIAHHIFVNGER